MTQNICRIFAYKSEDMLPQNPSDPQVDGPATIPTVHKNISILTCLNVIFIILGGFDFTTIAMCHYFLGDFGVPIFDSRIYIYHWATIATIFLLVLFCAFNFGKLWAVLPYMIITVSHRFRFIKPFHGTRRGRVSEQFDSHLGYGVPIRSIKSRRTNSASGSEVGHELSWS